MGENVQVQVNVGKFLQCYTEKTFWVNLAWNKYINQSIIVPSRSPGHKGSGDTDSNSNESGDLVATVAYSGESRGHQLAVPSDGSLTHYTTPLSKWLIGIYLSHHKFTQLNFSFWCCDGLFPKLGLVRYICSILSIYTFSVFFFFHKVH